MDSNTLTGNSELVLQILKHAQLDQLLMNALTSTDPEKSFLRDIIKKYQFYRVEEGDCICTQCRDCTKAFVVSEHYSGNHSIYDDYNGDAPCISCEEYMCGSCYRASNKCHICLERHS